MTGLSEVHGALRAALEPLGVEVGPEVLALWVDRERNGVDPLPAEALRRVAELAARLSRHYAVKRRVLLRSAEAALLAVVAVVLPATVTDPGLYLVLAAPCLLAAAALGCLEALRRR